MLATAQMARPSEVSGVEEERESGRTASVMKHRAASPTQPI